MNKLRENWHRTLGLILLTAILCQGQEPQKSIVLTSPANLSTAIRFYWFGDMESHFREPMNFYVVGSGDKRLHTTRFDQTFRKGSDAFITASEMQKLLDQLVQRDLLWSTSKKVETFGDSSREPASDGFTITVVSATGTARAKIRVARFCDELSQFDPLMPTLRMRWLFQTMRWDNGCDIPGYHNEEIPTD